MHEYSILHQIGKPYNRAEISFNAFVNNQVLPPLQNEQEAQQASCIYLIGGMNFLKGNTF